MWFDQFIYVVAFCISDVPPPVFSLLAYTGICTDEASVTTAIVALSTCVNFFFIPFRNLIPFYPPTTLKVEDNYVFVSSTLFPYWLDLLNASISSCVTPAATPGASSISLFISAIYSSGVIPHM